MSTNAAMAVASMASDKKPSMMTRNFYAILRE